MPEITEGLYRIVLEQTYRGQIVLNTFFYTNSLGNDDEQELAAQAFDEDVLPTIATVQHETVFYTSIRAQNVTGALADFVLTPTATEGDIVGTPMASFIAAAIRLNRTTKETRNGQKRFCGQTEELTDTQTWETSYVTLLETLGTVLTEQMITVGGIFDPQIARQDPQDPLTWVINAVASHTVDNRVRSQVSRKS